jgi:hypothetical protein
MKNGCVHTALKTGQLAVLSEQQILDCTPNPNQCGGTGTSRHPHHLRRFCMCSHG